MTVSRVPDSARLMGYDAKRVDEITEHVIPRLR
jgi:hypothetical protein